MLRLTHIINPVNIGPESDLYLAQPVTFASLFNALDFSRNDIQVNLITTQFAEDHSIVPDSFIKTDDLNRSVLDLGEFKHPRKLPLIRDILDRAYLYDNSADYIIYSNVDIAVMPFFYQFISSKINAGYDGLIINRRTISKDFASVEELPLMYSQIGETHPGYDCFVFKRSVYGKFVLENGCIGANWIGRILYANLLVFSSRLFIEDKGHVTFHLGEDGAWLNGNFDDYDLFNKKQAYQVIRALALRNMDKSRLDKLNDVIVFMDNWGIPQYVVKRRKRIAQRIISRIKSLLR
jgi:hypothetical protein